MNVGCSASDNDGLTSDNPIDHWKRCEEAQRKRMKLMGEEKEKLQKEIDTMNSVVVAATNISDDDIIKINAGGIIFSALRSTLTLVPDTMFSYMFSGRWEESLKRDENGCVFLDEDPEFIETIINFLRNKKREDPSNPIQSSPKVQEEKKEHFTSLLNYYGLTDFFYPPSDFVSLDINNIDVVQPHGSNVTVTKCKNKIKFSMNGTTGDYFVACKPTLDSSGEGSFWKVTIDAMPSPWFYLGIIGNLNASNVSYVDSTSYVWSSIGNVWVGGETKFETSGLSGFTEGDCLYFHLLGNKLKMFSVQKNTKFTMDIATPVGAYYIHFSTHYSGTKWTLEPLSAEERIMFTLTSV